MPFPQKNFYWFITIAFMSGLISVVPAYFGEKTAMAELFVPVTIPFEHSNIETQQSNLARATSDFMETIGAENPAKEQIDVQFKAVLASLRAIENSFGVTPLSRQSREEIQQAISEYMQKNGFDRVNQVTQALDAYSRYLTETLITQQTPVTERTVVTKL